MALGENKIDEEKLFSSDAAFDMLYPAAMRKLGHNHWTTLDAAKKAADFLAINNNVKILDIGSGVGKFCLAAAYHKPNAFFYGVEQRKNLVNYADKAKQKLGYKNVGFKAANFTEIDFTKYHHFYFYNSFYENLFGTQKIDKTIEFSQELYNNYNYYLYRQLVKMPVGTKLATYHVMEDEMAEGYHIVGTDLNNFLKYWEKI